MKKILLRLAVFVFGSLPVSLLAVFAGLLIYLSFTERLDIWFMVLGDSWAFAMITGFLGLCAFVFRPDLDRFSGADSLIYRVSFGFGIIAFAAPMVCFTEWRSSFLGFLGLGYIAIFALLIYYVWSHRERGGLVSTRPATVLKELESLG